jgi:hypothetical protein
VKVTTSTDQKLRFFIAHAEFAIPASGDLKFISQKGSRPLFIPPFYPSDLQPMKTLLVVFHSMTGGTRQMAEAAAKEAGAEPEVRVSLLHAADAGVKDVLEADGYIFATPENLGAMSGMMKNFFDRTYYAALDRIAGRPYAALICAGSDGENAARQMAHRYRLAFEAGCRTDHRLHLCADIRGNS